MSFFSRLFHKPVQLVESRVDKAKNQIRKEVAIGLARGSVAMTIALVILIMLFFLSAGVALYLNVVLESYFGGFFLVGGAYLLIIAYLLYLRSNKKFMDRVITYFKHQLHVVEEEKNKDNELILLPPEKHTNGKHG